MVRIKYSFFLLFLLLGTQAHAWSRHDLITHYAFEKVLWLEAYHYITATPFEAYLQKAYGKNFKKGDFLKHHALNETTKIGFEPGKQTSAKEILSYYSDEPDWGMDQNLDIHPDQKFMGGTKGPTSQAFRHLYWKTWSIAAPLRTFHFPPKEMGQALKRAQLYYDEAQKAFEVGEPYWGFRFLAWSLHYIQDLGQPFHSSQLLTPKYVSWKDILNFKKLVSRTTQIISNYHFLYEYYVAYRLEAEKKVKDKSIILALQGKDFWESSSAYLLAKHSSDFSNRFSYEIGETVYLFFGEKFLDPKIDVPNSPKDHYPMKTFDNNNRLNPKAKQAFLRKTSKNLEKTAYYSRSLLELAKTEFIPKLKH